MRIINSTNNTVLADNVAIANTPIKRIIGLLGRKEFKPGDALVIRHCNSIHTFFMQFAIDVLFIDRHDKVVKALHSLKPFRLSKVYFGAFAAIELPPGTIKSSLTSEGHYLHMED